MKKNSKKFVKHLTKVGRIGGLKTSEKKAAAVRQNGKKGGRPRKGIASESAPVVDSQPIQETGKKALPT
jgi:hypothetical protein